MIEPKIEYTIPRDKWERNRKGNCLPYSLARIFEKQTGKNINDWAFSQLIRKNLKDFEGGVNIVKALRWLKKEGIIQFWNQNIYGIPRIMRTHLVESPLLGWLKNYKRHKEGYYSYVENGKSHAVAIWGWDGEYWLVSDPNRTKRLYKMSDEIATRILHKYYLIIV